MTILDIVRSLICPKTSELIAQPFIALHHRSGEHIYKVLRAAYPDAHIRIADSDYDTIGIDEFNRWLKMDDVSSRLYQSEWHDCDDFARAIRCRIFAIGQEYKTSIAVAYCEGYTESGEYHAFNLMLDNTDQLHVLEPQTDFTILHHNSQYKADFIQL